MSDPLQDAITAMGTTLSAMTGLVRWYGDPPESLSEFPCGIAWGQSGNIFAEAGGWSLGIHTIIVDIFVARQVLPTAIDAAKAWPYKVWRALAADLQLGGTVQTVLLDRDHGLSYRFGPLQYGSDVHYGVRFEVPVKYQHTETISV